MNEQQLAYLQALDIPLWVDANRDLSPELPEELLAVCIINKRQWQDDVCKALWSKIMGALGWELSRIHVVHSAKDLPLAQHYIVFGKLKALPSPLNEQNTLSVASLKDMQASPDAKKMTWGKLKQLKVNT